MGAGQSAADVGEYVCGLGEAYRKYREPIIENGLSVMVVNQVQSQEIDVILESLGINNAVHRIVLKAHFSQHTGTKSFVSPSADGNSKNRMEEADQNMPRKRQRAIDDCCGHEVLQHEDHLLML